MSIFKKTLKALGFSGEDDDLEYQPYTAENITNACVREKEAQEEARQDAAQLPQMTAAVEEELLLPDTVLDAMIEMLNRSLPDYVVASLDKESEKKYLSQQLGNPFKEFISTMNARSREQVSQKWKTEHAGLMKEIEEAREKVKELEEQRNGIQSAQLSAERQKRAVTEKMHELEARIATLEAEKEQFELENKSLVNKLKVANVHQEELDEMRTENVRLMTELRKQRENAGDIEKLQAELQQANEALEQTANNSQDSTEELTKTKAELQQAKTDLDQLWSELAASKEVEAALNQQIESARKVQSEREIQVNQSIGRIQELEAELSTAKEALEAAMLLDTKLKQIEQTNIAKSGEIVKLSEQLKTIVAEKEELSQRLSEAVVQKELMAQNSIQKVSESGQEVETLKNELEHANVMLTALRNQRQELLAQIEELKTVKDFPVGESQEIDVPEPIQEESIPEEPTEPVISFSVPDKEPKSKVESKPVNEKVKPVERKEPKQEPVEVQSIEDDYPGLDDFDDNWLIPTRPDTPEMIARRKEEERKKKEEAERVAAEQKKARQVDSSQMSLW